MSIRRLMRRTLLFALVAMTPALALPPDWSTNGAVVPLLNDSERAQMEGRVAGAVALRAASAGPEIDAEWQGAIQWMSGINWGGETYFGSISRGNAVLWQ